MRSFAFLAPSAPMAISLGWHLPTNVHPVQPVIWTVHPVVFSATRLLDRCGLPVAAGHYCPDGHHFFPPVAPLPCPPGSYNPLLGGGLTINCLPCPAGFACTSEMLEGWAGIFLLPSCLGRLRRLARTTRHLCALWGRFGLARPGNGADQFQCSLQRGPLLPARHSDPNTVSLPARNMDPSHELDLRGRVPGLPSR